jgi:DNA polymerase III subunit gamma/tau
MYLALARKYRPQLFAELIGQTNVTRTLQNAIAMNKVYQALIFSGMKGVGKTSAARILAKALNCEKGPATEPCNQCALCREITEDTSPDYLEIDGASNNGVNEVRTLRETVKYKPIKNRTRIVVIDEVHMLSTAAWNALLKTIEEPPDNTVFIMATTDFHKIPATIVSRCQHFEFKRISYDVIKQVLADICKKEVITISDYSLYLISRAAEGSLRDAKKILDQAIAISHGDIKDADVSEILGIIDEEIFIDLTRAILGQDRQAILVIVHNLAERGLDLRFFYNEYLKFIRDLIVVKAIEDSEKLHTLNPDNLPKIRELLKNVGDIELLRYLNTMKDAEQMVKNTENPRIILEYLLLKLSYLPKLLAIADVINQIRSGAVPVKTDPIPEREPVPRHDASPAPARPPAPGREHAARKPAPAPSVTDQEAIAAIKTRIESDKPRMASAMHAAQVQIKPGENVLHIHLPAGFDSALKLMKDQQDYMKEVALQACGRDMRIELTIAPPDEKGDEKEMIRKLKDDAAISGLRDLIGGRIGPIENIKGGKDA